MDKIWGDTLVSLRAQVPAHSLATWFHGVRPVHMDESRFVISCPSRMSLDWINDNYRPLLERAIAAASRRTQVQLVLTLGEPAPAPPSAGPAPRTSAKGGETAEPSTLPTNHRLLTFERFVTGPSNGYAYGAAAAIAEGTGRRYNPLYLHSGVGLGKTHLGCSIVNRVHLRRVGLRATLVPAEQFIHECVGAMRKGDTEAFRRRYRNGADVLILEDVQFLTGKPRTQAELLHALEELLSAGKQVVFTGNIFPSEIAEMEEGLKSRLGSGLVVEILPPSIAEREEIVRRKAAEEGVDLAPDVAHLVARAVSGNVRALESALTRLLFLASYTSRQPDLAVAREALTPFLARQRVPMTPEGIRDFVAKHHGLEGCALATRSRKRNLSQPRQIGIALARKLTPASLAVIGRAFARDHASVVHALGALERRMATDARLRGQVEFLEKRLLTEFEVGGR